MERPGLARCIRPASGGLRRCFLRSFFPTIVFLFPFHTPDPGQTTQSDPSHTSIPCSAAARPERWPHPAATSWRRDEAAHAGASLRLLSPSNLAPPPAARRLPPVGLLLRGSRLVDPARGRVAGPPNISTPMPTSSASALPTSCSPARDWLACLPCDLLPSQQQKYDYSPCYPLYFSLQVQQSAANLDSKYITWALVLCYT